MLDGEKLSQQLYDVVNSIKNPDVMHFTKSMLSAAPACFWTEKASREHHLEDERGPFGNLLHTIRVARTVEILCEVAGFNGVYKDVLVSGAALHDTCRHGLDGQSESSVPEHARLVRELAKKHGLFCGQSTMIFGIIESHMGRWGKPFYAPSLSLSAILHVADVICARMSHIIKEVEEDNAGSC